MMRVLPTLTCQKNLDINDESNDGDLKIAETSADSGINESLDNSVEERTL